MNAYVDYVLSCVLSEKYVLSKKRKKALFNATSHIRNENFFPCL